MSLLNDCVRCRGTDPHRLVGSSTLNPWETQAYASPPFNRSAIRAAFAWTRALRGKTVLVVHPFIASIRAQLAKGGEALWGELAPDVMPASIQWKLVRAPMNLCALHEQESWREAYAELVRRVDAAGRFDVAAVSCGGLGMLLGAHLKATGRAAIYFGGALQLWFGVVGKRWRAARMMQSNANWAWTLPEDVPNCTGASRPSSKLGDVSAYWSG